MYRIRKEFHFSASHIIEGLPEGHPCGRLHGHNYKVELFLASPDLNEVGFVRDFGHLSDLKAWIDRHLDHQHLNDVLPEGVPVTAECLARYLFDFCYELWHETDCVRVWETPKAYAEYYFGK